MVVKNVDGTPQWLFPECFQYILERQQPDGGWEEYASEIDGILNTMAALLTMKSRCQTSLSPDCLKSRIVRAISYLKQKLGRWDVEACLHVGFEVLVPALLSMLEQDGLYFSFPGRDKLMTFNQEKLSRFDAQSLYTAYESTIIHSLEAFIGKIVLIAFGTTCFLIQ